MDQREQLQAKAQRYRDYVRWITDPDIAESILRLASDLERQAIQPDEEDIRTRAYDYWRRAGEPENRDEAFWLQAERDLRNEAASYPRRIVPR